MNSTRTANTLSVNHWDGIAFSRMRWDVRSANTHTTLMSAAMAWILHENDRQRPTDLCHFLQHRQWHVPSSTPTTFILNIYYAFCENSVLCPMLVLPVHGRLAILMSAGVNNIWRLSDVHTQHTQHAHIRDRVAVDNDDDVNDNERNE